VTGRLIRITTALVVGLADLGDIILQQNYHKMSTFHGETVAVPDSNLLDRSTRDNHTPQSQTPGVR
jgi:hypothetical protein